MARPREAPREARAAPRQPPRPASPGGAGSLDGLVRRRLLLTIAVAVGAGALILLLAAGLLRPSTQPRSTSAGADKPLLKAPLERETLPDAAGETLLPPPPEIAFRSLRGKPAFLNVWASWCPSCREEAPTMARLAHEHGADVRFVGIDVQDSREDGRAFVRRYNLEFPQIFDPKAEIAGKLGVFGIPTVFFVDERGRIAAVLTGKQSEAKLERYLQALKTERS